MLPWIIPYRRIRGECEISLLKGRSTFSGGIFKALQRIARKTNVSLTVDQAFDVFVRQKDIRKNNNIENLSADLARRWVPQTASVTISGDGIKKSLWSIPNPYLFRPALPGHIIDNAASIHQEEVIVQLYKGDGAAVRGLRNQIPGQNRYIFQSFYKGK